MSAACRAWVIAGVAAVSLLLAGMCHGGDKPKSEADQPLSTRILGAWASDPVQTPLGKATQTFCFGADGTVTSHSNTQAGPRSGAGTYRLEADRVTMLWPDTGDSVVLKVSWSGERLVLTDGSQESRSYRRASKGC